MSKLPKILFLNHFIKKGLGTVRQIATQTNAEEKNTHFGFETVRESEKQEKGQFKTF